MIFRRKRTWIIILLLCTVAVGYYTLGVLRYESAESFSIKGVDISNQLDGQLNWSKLDPHLDFVILRAVRSVDKNPVPGENTFVSKVDPNFQKNWDDLGQRQIVRGAYHFFSPDVPAKEQFEVFKKVVKLKKGDLPPILDVEKRQCDMEQAMVWLQLAKEYYGVEPILYTDYFFYQVFLRRKAKDCKLWIYLNGNFSMRPSFNDPDCVLWQYKQDTYVPGFQEAVDLNVFLGDSVTFKELLVK